MALASAEHPLGFLHSGDGDSLHPSMRRESCLPKPTGVGGLNFPQQGGALVPSQAMGGQVLQPSMIDGDGEENVVDQIPPSVRLMTNAGGPMECRWSPYVNNGGTVLAVAGDNYAVVIGDTRLSIGYAIHTRKSSKIMRLTSKCVIATAGMQSEMLTLHRLLKIRVDLYKHRHRTEPSVTAVAQMLSVVLYSKRFFPYYTFNLLAGIDDEGKGAVYGYDAIGSCERGLYNSAGTGGTLMMSILDNRIGKTNQKIPTPNLSKVEVIDFVKDAITSAAERDIFTGDQAEVVVVDAAGISTSTMELRKD